MKTRHTAELISALVLLVSPMSSWGYSSNWETGFFGTAFAMLKFTNGAGSIATDESTNKCNALFNSTLWTNRPGAGGAMSFPESFGYITNDALSDVQYITIAVWIKITNGVDDFNRIIEKSYSSSFMLGTYKDSTLSVASYCKGTELLFAPIPTNEWVHVGFIHDGTNDFLFKNGDCVGTNADEQVWSAPSTKLSIGGDQHGSYRLQGIIGDLLLSHKASGDEVIRHYLSTCPSTNVPTENIGVSRSLLVLDALLSEANR